MFPFCVFFVIHRSYCAVCTLPYTVSGHTSIFCKSSAIQLHAIIYFVVLVKPPGCGVAAAINVYMLNVLYVLCMTFLGEQGTVASKQQFNMIQVNQQNYRRERCKYCAMNSCSQPIMLHMVIFYFRNRRQSF